MVRRGRGREPDRLHPLGRETAIVTVEVDVATGLPDLATVGLPDAAGQAADRSSWTSSAGGWASIGARCGCGSSPSGPKGRWSIVVTAVRGAS